MVKDKIQKQIEALIITSAKAQSLLHDMDELQEVFPQIKGILKMDAKKRLGVFISHTNNLIQDLEKLCDHTNSLLDAEHKQMLLDITFKFDEVTTEIQFNHE